MSRKLKFRAWAYASKCWIDELYIGGDGDIASYDGLDYSLSQSLQNVIVEQYTGLEDKNGKEIYEGDIVRYGDQASEVKFDEMKDSDCSYYYLGWAMGDLSLCEHNTMAEVIGNIHENPELLGGKE